MLSFTVSISCVLMRHIIASYVADVYFFQYETMATIRSFSNNSHYFRIHKPDQTEPGRVWTFNLKLGPAQASPKPRKLGWAGLGWALTITSTRYRPGRSVFGYVRRLPSLVAPNG